MEDLITVVITTYKRSDKIEDAIISVIEQTYKNIEIIVVDDNALLQDEREKTQKIVEKYKQVKYIKNEKNLGGALSRNVGIENATGKFVAFLDDDDKYEKDKIEKQFQCYLQHKNDNVGLIYCYCYRENQEGKVVGSYQNDYEGNKIYENMMGCIAGTSLWFCPKEVLISVGMFENTPCKQDSIMLLKILCSGYNIYRVPENLVYYYEHGGSGISGTKKKNIEGLLNYRNWCRKNYDKITKKQQENVEFNFSKQLITLYVFNDMIKEARIELKGMIKSKPFNKKTWISLGKIIFRQQYIKTLERKKNAKKSI